MMNYSRVEIDELGEEIVRQFIDGYTPDAECVNIELFVTDYLKLPLVYESFAEEETDRLGFTSNGKRKLKVMREGKQVELVFPTHTIVVDSYLKKQSEDGKRRFTIAHEAAHNIFDRDNGGRCEAHFYSGFDSEKEYSVEALRERMNMCEWQANSMAAAILMPRFLVEQALQKYAGRSSPSVIYKKFSIYTEELIQEVFVVVIGFFSHGTQSDITHSIYAVCFKF